MLLLSLVYLAFVLFITRLSSFQTNATNSYPILLVNGFTGWGRNELEGFKYWGGIQGDFQTELEAEGYTVYTASVGPFSSNWDRACELYAIIKGGRVDYGQNHSTTYNHLRFGRNHTGLYPEWGNLNSDGSINKIHLVGHSMGGQTSRMLTQMLKQGTTGAPIEEEASSHPLFQGGKMNWVHSITTISAPNQGSTLADASFQIEDLAKDLIAFLLTVIGIFQDTAKILYDAKMDQWGVTSKESGESLRDYINRVWSSHSFENHRDLCIWSLSTRGAREEATWVKTFSDVYYYSYATIDTHTTHDLFFRKISFPNILTMSLPLLPLAVILGGRYAPDVLNLSTDWQPNDGMVNTISMGFDGVARAIPFAGLSQPGIWNMMPQLNQIDHLGIIGCTLHSQVLDLYKGHAALLAALPTIPHSRRLQDSASAVTEVHTAISKLTAATSSVKTKNDLKVLCHRPKNSYARNYCTNVLKSRYLPN